MTQTTKTLWFFAAGVMVLYTIVNGYLLWKDTIAVLSYFQIFFTQQ